MACEARQFVEQTLLKLIRFVLHMPIRSFVFVHFGDVSVQINARPRYSPDWFDSRGGLPQPGLALQGRSESSPKGSPRVRIFLGSRGPRPSGKISHVGDQITWFWGFEPKANLKSALHSIYRCNINAYDVPVLHLARSKCVWIVWRTRGAWVRPRDLGSGQSGGALLIILKSNICYLLYFVCRMIVLY